MTNTLQERDWDLLLRRIWDRKCTPFLGAGACYGTLPLGFDIARAWAQKHDYPLQDSGDLARVAQFLAVKYDVMYPKEEILKEFFAGVKPPKFTEPDEPHGVLADLPLSVYMTTNYDDFITEALESRFKDAKREFCRWYAGLKTEPSIFDADPKFTPTPANPLVFHLHGHNQVPESLVLTEDDYLTFLVNMSSQQVLLPAPVQRALAADSLLFIGYSLSDWTFRVLIQTLRAVGRLSIAVLLPPQDAHVEPEKVQTYLTRYYEQITRMDLRIYWGTAREFAAELREHWNRFSRQQ